MMRFGRIFAALAILALQPSSVMKAGSCPHTRVDTNNTAAGAASWVTADSGPGVTNELVNYGLWAAAVSLDLSFIGDLLSYAAGSWNGEVYVICPSGAYVPQGNCETITQIGGGAPDVENAGAAVAGAPPDVYAWTKTKESLIGDDGDSVQESVVIYGTVNIQLTGSADGSSAGVMAGATITGPGVNGGFGLELSEGGYSANGSITYTDRSFQTHTIYASDLVENGVISLTLETAAISAEGSTFSVNSLAASGGTFGVGRNDTAAAQATSMVGWAFESVAP